MRAMRLLPAFTPSTTRSATLSSPAKKIQRPESPVQHRKITIVKRLRQYVDMLCAHPELETDILPLGDGVAISVKGR